MSKILILGGTGAMGIYLTEELKKTNHEVFVTSRSSHENCGNIRYIQGDAKDCSFLFPLLEQKFDCIVDFMIYNTFEFVDRYRKILSCCRQYIFSSTYRVYADNGLEPINENSPKLLDVSTDKTYLKTDEYALTKARQENLLRESGMKNWTIIRPSITFSKKRFQLGTLEAGVILPLARKKCPVILPAEMLDKYSAVSWGGYTAKMIAALILNPEAFGEAFNVCSSEMLTWKDVASYYHTLTGLTVFPVSLDEYIKVIGGKYQVMYDRMYNRIMDNSKILNLMGLTPKDLLPAKDALALELADLEQKFSDVSPDKKRCKRIRRFLRRYLWRHPIKYMQNLKKAAL